MLTIMPSRQPEWLVIHYKFKEDIVEIQCILYNSRNQLLFNFTYIEITATHKAASAS